MNEVQLSVKARETGKQAAKKYRRNGYIPGIFYEKDGESFPILAENLAMRSIVFTSEKKLIKLEVEGSPKLRDCILKNVDFDPVTDNIIHFDLQGILGEQIITVEIPIILTGQSVGVREGGIMQHSLRKVKVHCPPQYMPNHIEVDISSLKIGKSIHLKDLVLPNVAFELHPDTVVASVVTSRVGREKAGEQAAVAQQQKS